MKAASLVLALLVAAPSGVALAAPDAPPPVAAPPVAAPPAATPPVAAPPATTPPPAAPPAPPPLGLSMGPPSTMGPPSEAGAAPMAPVAVGTEAPRSGGTSPLVAFSLSFSMPIAVVAAGVLMDPDDGAGAAMLILGAVAGPSTGWLYAGRPGMAALTAGMRLGGALLAIRVLDDGSNETALPLLGMAIFATATLIDWIGPAVSVANANARNATVVPTVTPGGGAGLSFAGTF